MSLLHSVTSGQNVKSPGCRSHPQLVGLVQIAKAPEKGISRDHEGTSPLCERSSIELCLLLILRCWRPTQRRRKP